MTALPSPLDGTTTPVTVAEFNAWMLALSALFGPTDNGGLPMLGNTAGLPLAIFGGDPILETIAHAGSAAYTVGADTFLLVRYVEQDAGSTGTTVTPDGGAAVDLGFAGNAFCRECTLVLGEGDAIQQGHANDRWVGTLLSAALQSDLARVLTTISTYDPYIVDDDEVFYMTHLSSTYAPTYTDQLMLDGVSCLVFGAMGSTRRGTLFERGAVPISQGSALTVLADGSPTTSTALLSGLTKTL